MAYTEQANQFDYTPNSDAPFELATSYNPKQLDLAADEGGYGSFLNRSVDDELLYYWASKHPFDQMSMIYGKSVETPTGVKEFFEADAMYDYEAQGVQEDATDVINNTDGVNTYVPAANARFVIDTDNKSIFSEKSEVRYPAATGWAYAYVDTIDDAAAETELNLISIDGSNLPVATANTASIQHIATNLPQDLDYDEQPKSSDPTPYEAYVENPRKEIKWTRKEQNINQNGGTVIDMVKHYQKQLTANFRKERERKTLLGSGANLRKKLANGDVVNFSNGIYNQIRDNNLHTSDFKSTGTFDGEKFRKAIYQFMLYNYGGEGGATDIRDFYVDPVMQSYFDEAWEGRERFLGGSVNTEFVAGVTVNRVQNSQGRLDVMTVPDWNEFHPKVDAALRGGSTPRGVGMLMPMDGDHVKRIVQTGFAPRQEVYQKDGGSRLWFNRIESKESIYLSLLPHMAILEEVAE